MNYGDIVIEIGCGVYKGIDVYMVYCVDDCDMMNVVCVEECFYICVQEGIDIEFCYYRFFGSGSNCCVDFCFVGFWYEEGCVFFC